MYKKLFLLNKCKKISFNLYIIYLNSKSYEKKYKKYKNK